MTTGNMSQHVTGINITKNIYIRDSTRNVKLKLSPFVCVWTGKELVPNFNSGLCGPAKKNTSIPWQHSYKTSILFYTALKAFFARGKRGIRHTINCISTKNSVCHQRNDGWNCKEWGAFRYLSQASVDEEGIMCLAHCL